MTHLNYLIKILCLSEDQVEALMFRNFYASLDLISVVIIPNISVRDVKDNRVILVQKNLFLVKM